MKSTLSENIKRVCAHKPIRFALFAIAFGLLGTVALSLSHAATPAASTEAENGTISTNASVVTDSSASGSQTVKFGTGDGQQGGTCNLNATTANFASQVSAATAGQRICLATGDYGAWTGANKAITIAAASGATPTMSIDFNTGDSGFTLDGMIGMHGSIVNGANHITIRNSTFTGALVLDSLSNSNVVIDSSSFNNMSVSSCSDLVERIWIEDSNGPTGVTVSNSTFSGGNMDGIRLDASGGATVTGNQFINVAESGPDDCQHSDSIQMYGGENNVISNNYFVGGSDGIVAFDGTANNQITGNACGNLDRGSCITLYSDSNSIVSHNSTISSMSLLEIDHKSGDPAGVGTTFSNNVGDLNVANGSTVSTNTHNLFSGGTSPNINGNPTFVGGSSPTNWAGFKLTTGSLGIGAATDGSNVGIN